MTGLLDELAEELAQERTDRKKNAPAKPLLFAGATGTGKTKAALAVADKLGMSLRTIDASKTVSKYLGETEKNLDRIFNDAGNEVLLFLEAEALFGKRSEVKDAHDRYANIDIQYLLKRMQKHEGPVILATNNRRNIDAAFVRRMRHIVTFPLRHAG